MKRVNDRRILALLVSAAIGVFAVSCRQQSSVPQPSPGASTAIAPTNARIYPVKGVVKEVHAERKSVTIQHEEVPGYMPAMSMPFEVRDAAELKGLQPGDAVSFRMLVTDTDGWIDQVTKLGAANVAGVPRESVRRVRIVEPLEIGDAVPDYPFTNELNQPISLGRFKGKALGLTFIFTRCPFPNFCPRMSENFSAAYQKLSSAPEGPKNWHLLSLSFDPEFDTPAVLKNYARRYQYDTNHWSFATGAWIEIDAITEQFGLEFSRAQSGVGWDHKLRTVVIDAAGKVQKVYTGNAWTVDDFVEEMRKATAAK
jgi:protein SCO1/2